MGSERPREESDCLVLDGCVRKGISLDPSEMLLQMACAEAQAKSYKFMFSCCQKRTNLGCFCLWIGLFWLDVWFLFCYFFSFQKILECQLGSDPQESSAPIFLGRGRVEVSWLSTLAS